MKILTKSHKKRWTVFLLVLGLIVSAFLVAQVLISSPNFSVLAPKGIIAEQQKDLFYFALGLSAIIVLPVFALTIFIAWNYRAGNKKKRYEPEWGHSRLLESVWWGVPILLIFILSIVTYQTAHKLDPFKPIEADAKELKIQVISMNWKWLFVYPEQDIATVNYLQLPVDRPVKFQITADSAMNSFWIPELAGQIYAMPGMNTELHVLANKEGEYRGSSANISGRGFAGMKFMASVASESDFNEWVNSVKKSNPTLDSTAYSELARPSTNNPPALYGSVEQDLFNGVIRKYLEP